MKQNLTLILTGLSILLAGFTLLQTRSLPTSAKNGYIQNQKVFAAFAGTKELEKRLVIAQQKQKNILDSLASLIQLTSQTPSSALTNKQLRNQYQQLYTQYEQDGQALNQQYTAQAWKQLNQYIREFGQQNGYQFIYGADGTGGVMYADSTYDLTDPVTTYANKKYAGE